MATNNSYRQWFYDGEWHDVPKPKPGAIQFEVIPSLPAGLSFAPHYWWDKSVWAYPCRPNTAEIPIDEVNAYFNKAIRAAREREGDVEHGNSTEGS